MRSLFAKLVKVVKKHPTQTALLVSILLIGLFMRVYHLVGRFEFAHDGDLYSWFVKDVVVDKHLRLIGQLTSAPGIFIGPAFYYSLIPFFLLFNMDPIGGTLMITLLALLTMLSYFYVFNKLFNTKVALIITFLQAISLFHANFDRAVVPTTPTHLWAVWYFFAIVEISQKRFKYALPLLGLLIGYIWHLHVALLPALLSLPLAFFFAKKIPSKKEIISFILTFVVTSLPLILFETRHNFSQTQSFIANLTEDHGASKGTYKLSLVLEMISKNITNLFLYPLNVSNNFRTVFTIATVAIAVFLTIKKFFPPKMAALSLVWIIGMIIFFTVSSSPISEYYFANFEIIFLLIVALILAFIFEKIRYGKYLVVPVLILLLIYNLNGLINWTDAKAGYVSRKAAIDFIRQDMTKNDYPCISLNYITIVGENVGFRFFLWRNKIQVVPPSEKIPSYQIALPAGLSNEVTFSNGLVGVILPTKDYQKPANLRELCGDIDKNETDSMFGFVK